MAFGGSVDNLIGDGVMAVFGAPKELPEPSRRGPPCRRRSRCFACRRARASRPRARHPRRPEVRVGVNTAHCTVGVFGSEAMRAYMAVGFAVNVAARLETAAEPGSVLCGFRTYALVKDRVKAEERGQLMVKGRDARSRRGRSSASPTRDARPADHRPAS